MPSTPPHETLWSSNLTCRRQTRGDLSGPRAPQLLKEVPGMDPRPQRHRRSFRHSLTAGR
jgi:hypothetical protein